MNPIYSSIVAASPDGNVTIEINPSLEDLLDLEGFEKVWNKQINNIRNKARSFWETEAGRRLKSSRNEYVNSIHIVILGPQDFQLAISGFVPVAVESGIGPYPMNVPRGKVVPLNVDREVNFRYPKVFRTGNGEPWQHPGLPGVKIAEAVVEYIDTKLIPEAAQKALEKL